MRVSLRAVADDRDLLPLDERQIGVFFVIDLHGSLRSPLDPQHALAAADARGSGAHDLENHPRLERLQERIELLAWTGELDRVALVGHVEDAAAKNIREPLHLVAVL